MAAFRATNRPPPISCGGYIRAMMAVLTYSYRPHVLAPERLFRLQNDGIARSASRRAGLIPYTDFEQVRVFKARFLGSSATYWNLELTPRSSGRIKLGAASRVGFNTIDDRTSVYLPFIHELQARLLKANPDLRVETGRSGLHRVEVA